MKWNDIFQGKKEESQQEYLGLFLKETEGIVLFINIQNNVGRVIAQEKFKYSNGWDNILEDLDEVVYKLEGRTKKTPSKAIFFIYSHFIDRKTNNIKNPYFDRIKNLIKNLELEPLGYIECHEALSESLKKKGEIPLTAVLVEFDKETLGILVYRAGKLVFETNVSRTTELLEDVLPVFEKVRAQMVIPSKIILYNSTDLDLEASSLATYRWKEGFFIQIPKVQVIHEEDLMDSLIQTFISQVASTASISHKKPPAEIMGFVMDGEAERLAAIPPPSAQSSQASTLPKLNLDFKRIYNIILSYLSSIKLPKQFFKNSTLFWAGGLLILAALFLMEFFFHKATVELYLPSKDLKKNVKITTGTGGLPIESLSKTVTLKESKATTGKKEIGERAKGGVVIYNSSLSEAKTFPKGTVLISASSLKFVLDNDVKVASASGDASSITSSTAKGAVTAAAIGPESNIATGSKLSIEGQSASTVLAKNDAAFSGGSKREVRTVASADINQLKEAIEKKAVNIAKTEVKTKLKKDSRLIDPLTTYETKQSTLSKEIGEEAGSVEMSSQVSINYFPYNQEAMLNLLAAQFKDDADKDFKVNKQRLTYQITKAIKDGNKYNLEVSASAKLTKDIDKKATLNKMVGRGKKSLEKLARETLGANKMEFIISHPLPFIKGMMPLFSKNIELEILYK